MGAGILWVPLFFWSALMTPLCIKVGDRTSWRGGWLMATAVIFLPLALFVAMLIP